MQFATVQPHAALQPWVRYYWLLDAQEGFTLESEALAPDGAFEMVVHLTDPPLQRVGAAWERQPHEILVGEIQRSTILRADLPLRCAGVHFAPGGIRAFFDESATELRDTMTRLDSVQRPMAPLRERLSLNATPYGIRQIFDAVLLARLRARAPGSRVRSILSALERSRGWMPIERLASDAGVSSRQLERLLAPVLGIPPKRFARVVRFHHAFSSLLGGDRDGALDGYYDEPHFLRDLREFASAPARALLDAPLHLNRQFHRAGAGPR